MSNKVSLSGHATFAESTAKATLRVEPASDVIVEDSPTRKFLLLKNGEFICWKSVFLVVGGEKIEITVDHLPEER